MSKPDNLIDIAMAEADEIFMQLLDDYPIIDDNDHRQASLLLCMMNNCISRLHVLGWTEQELCNEVFDWCKQARAWQDKHSK